MKSLRMFKKINFKKANKFNINIYFNVKITYVSCRKIFGEKMKKILFGLVAALLLVGCSPKENTDTKVEAKIVMGKSLADLKLNDQFEKEQTLNKNTKKIIFAFSKDMAHLCNDYFATQTPSYLDENYTQFVADVSTAPSIIRSMFIMPGLKDFKHTVLILEDENTALSFRAGVDIEKIIVAYLEDGKITQIKTISTVEELKNMIEAK